VSRYIEEHRGRFGVEPICRTLGVSASAYYQRATGERSERALEDERLVELIETTHARNYFAYGYRRMWKALLRAGEQVSRCRVQRLMREHGIVGAKRRGKPWRTTRPDAQAHRRPDLVQRDFNASRPDELWVADLSYLRCWQGLVFFAFVIDAFSRRVVGWQLAANMRTTLVLDALRMALGTRGLGADVQLVHHSDRGSQGGFKWSSQRLIDRRLRWASGSGRRIVHAESRCVRRGGRRLGVGSIACGSGLRSVAESRVSTRRVRRVCPPWLVSGGLGRVAACRLSLWPRCRGVTCRSLSGRRSLCCEPRNLGCVRSLVGLGVRRRRSRVSCAGTPGLAVAR
jgi:hypothetical protein